MQLVAIAITPEQWEKLTGHIDDAEMRNVVAAVAKQTKLTLLQYCEREAGQKDKASIGLRALADRFKKNMTEELQDLKKKGEDMSNELKDFFSKKKR